VLAGLRLTEIMYHPAGDAEAEFLELRNTGAASIDLEGLRFVEGVTFVFPALALPPGEFVYVVKNLAAFTPPNLGGLVVAGEYSGELDDDGERLRLELAFGAAVIDTTYTDSALGSDGGGNSLELADAAVTGLKDSGWTSSAASGGTPGAHTQFEDNASWVAGAFPPAEAADPQISGPDRDPDGDGLANLLERLFGRDPIIADAGELPAVSFENGMAVLRFDRSVAAGDIEAEVTYSEDLVEWQRNAAGLEVVIVSAQGGLQTVEARLPVGALGRGFLRIEAQLQ
jgi:hypothetical protein